MRRFWNWVQNNDTRTLVLDGPISSETWWGDEVTPQMFKEELNAGTGDIAVWINSPGGDCFAAAQIYNMLMEYPGQVVVKIDGIAASAATVVAMAGSEVHMSPVSMFMIHNPATIAWGESKDMRQAEAMLNEVKESIVNAYELKTGLSRTKLAHMMDDETWMNAKKAFDLGFADQISYTGDAEQNPEDTGTGVIFSRMAVTNSLLSKFPPMAAEDKAAETNKTDTPIEALEKRLFLLAH